MGAKDPREKKIIYIYILYSLILNTIYDIYTHDNIIYIYIDSEVKLCTSYYYQAP